MFTEGIHEVEVISHNFMFSGSGTPGITFCFHKLGEDDQAVMYGTIWLSQKAMGMARKSLKAVGFDIDKRNLSELEGQDGMLAGNKCQIDVRSEEYPIGSGKYNLKCAFINPIPEPLGKARFDKLTQALRDAKKDDEPAAKTTPKKKETPAERVMTPDEKAEHERLLNAQAEKEDIPF